MSQLCKVTKFENFLSDVQCSRKPETYKTWKTAFVWLELSKIQVEKHSNLSTNESHSAKKPRWRPIRGAKLFIRDENFLYKWREYRFHERFAVLSFAILTLLVCRQNPRTIFLTQTPQVVKPKRNVPCNLKQTGQFLQIAIQSSEKVLDERWDKYYEMKDARREAKALKREEWSWNLLQRSGQIYSHNSTFFTKEPETYNQAISSCKKENWLQAMQDAGWA